MTGTSIARPADAPRDRTWEHRDFGTVILLSEADYALLRAMRPRCAVCGRPVDRFDWHVDPDTKLHMIYTAYCHGDSETMRLSMREMKALLAGGVQGGEAFAGKLLTEDKA